MDYFNILREHKRAELSCFIWGSSGFGKTSLVKDYADRSGYSMYAISAATMDPLTLILPRVEKESGCIETFPCRWLHACCTATASKPIVLFLDEITRVRNVQTLNLLTELILERKVDNHYLSPHCQILAASNLSEEDHGVLELPDAVMQRFTHLIHAPSLGETIDNMCSAMAKEALRMNPKVLAKPTVPDLPLKASPRQIDAVVKLFELGTLSEEEMGVCARGRVGIEAGNSLIATLYAIKAKKERELPPCVEPKHFERLFKMEEAGKVIEVIAFLRDDSHEKRHVADYLLQYALPETVRAMHENKFVFSYAAGEFPMGRDGKPYKDAVNGNELAFPGMSWQFFALMIQKISEKRQ